VTEVVGYSLLDGQVKSNSAMLIMTLEPFGHREDPALSVDGIITHLRGQFDAIREANVIAYNLPPIIGLGTGSGFEYQLESLSGSSPADLAAVARGLVFAANQEPVLEAVFTTYAANTPQLYLDIDREKLQTLGVDLSEVFNSLQAVLAAPMSTTSTSLVAPGRSTCRARPRTAARSTTSIASTCATIAGRWCRCVPS
jgi:multidrug efflux pump subunit AcrB